VNKRIGFIGLTSIAIGSMATGVSSAQEPAARGVLEEIYVTARRIEERLQDVPLSVTAFSASDLEDRNIRNIRDLANYTPNLTFNAGADGRGNSPVIRGIGLIDGRGFDNAVGIFIDGIFVSGRAAQNVAMLDLERVEVVKGPQSALYGRNTFSGAINYVTRTIPDELTMNTEATVGSQSLYRASGAVSGPLTERLSARLAVAYEDDKGTFRNSGPAAAGSGLGGGEYKSALVSFNFKPTDELTIQLSGLWSDEFGDSRPLSIIPNNCGQFDPAQARSATGSDLANPLFFCGEGQPSGSNKLSVSPESFAFDNQTKRGTLAITWDLPGVQVQSLSGFTSAKSLSQLDLDRTQAGFSGYGYAPLAVYQAFGSPAFICSGFIPAGPCAPPNGGTAPLFNQIRAGTFNQYFGAQTLDSDYWSSELRFTGTRDTRLRWSGGLFQFRSKNDDSSLTGIDASAAVADLGLPPSQIQFFILDPVTVIPGLAPSGIAVRSALPNLVYLDGAGTVVLTATPLIAVQSAIFGSLDYDFTDRLTGTAELRYTWESQDVNNKFDGFFGSSGRFKTDSNYADPRATLRYALSQDQMLYGSIARGTRSGGINAAVTNPDFVSFEEETNITYEVGFKSSLADRRVQLDVAAFYIDWKDGQFRQTLPTQTPGTTLTVTTNAAKVRSMGVELSVAARLTDNWSLDGNIGLSDPKFASGTFTPSLNALCRTLPAASSPYPVIPVNCVGLDLDGNGTVDSVQPDISRNQLPLTSRLTTVLGLEYTRPVVGDGRVVARLDGAYRSKQYQDFTNVQTAPGRTLMNFRIWLERENYDLMLWVENLTDEDAVEQIASISSQNFTSLSFGTTVLNRAQRRYGVTARYRF
jgi:iron complex outermembrane recepter protein